MKMNKELKECLLNEARHIGDQLLAEAETDEQGMYWKTMTMDLQHHISFSKSESIYTGVSGIVLFFLELYKQTRDPRYMEAAVAGMKWVVNYCEKNPSDFYAFFTGRMGVPYTLLRMHDFTREEEYLERALFIARAGNNTFEGNNKADDLINGRSGALLGLLHLHAVTGEKWILEDIDVLIRHLLESAFHGPAGLYWDRSPLSINGLCGFSHGAAGIGFVFLELGHYFQNDAFYRAAEQAFLYERYFYQEAKLDKNWPDLRKGIYSDEDEQKHRNAFLQGDLDFFTRPGNMNAWCHGAAGIGLSRVRAYQLLKKPVYKDEVQIAVEKSLSTDIQSQQSEPAFILCHGSGGNAELFLYAHQIFGEEKYLSMAETIARKALDYHKKNNLYLSGFGFAGKKEDRSLFMGNAGIGYFLLRLLEPFHVPSVLVPTIDKTLRPGESASLSLYPYISISLADLQKQLFQKDFKRTLWVSAKIMSQKLNAFLHGSQLDSNDTGVSFIKSFVGFIEASIPSLPAKEKEILADVFDLELKKRQMDEKIISHSMQSMKEKILRQKGKEIVEEHNRDFVKLTFGLEPEVRLVTPRWNWDASDREKWISNLDRETGQEDEDFWPVLLSPTPLGIAETQLSLFSYTILSEFQEPGPVEKVIQAT
ncbi:MAG: hypothetical protein JSV88_04065, partial [Candidatus Aminicenantes bacterium]